MNRRLVLLLLSIMLLAAGLTACSSKPPAETPKSAVSLGTVKLNAHPSSLEGKTVVLRWNSKPNGDKLLNNVAELLTKQVPGVKIIKLWETDPSTASISKSQADSAALAGKVAALKPDIVIASQAD